MQGYFTNAEPGYNASVSLSFQSGDRVLPDKTTGTLATIDISKADSAYWSQAAPIEITHYLGRKTTAIATNSTTTVAPIPTDVKKYIEVLTINSLRLAPRPATMAVTAASLVLYQQAGTNGGVKSGKLFQDLTNLLEPAFSAYSYSGNAGVTPAPTDPNPAYATPVEPLVSDTTPAASAALTDTKNKLVNDVRSYLVTTDSLNSYAQGNALTIPANYLLTTTDLNLLEGFIMEKYSLLPNYNRIQTVIARFMTNPSDPSFPNRAIITEASNDLLVAYTYTPVIDPTANPPTLNSYLPANLLIAKPALSGSYTVFKSNGTQVYSLKGFSLPDLDPTTVSSTDSFTLRANANFYDYRTDSRNPTITPAKVTLSFNHDATRNIELTNVSIIKVNSNDTDRVLVSKQYAAFADLDKSSAFKVATVSGRRLFTYSTATPTPSASPTP